MTQAKYRDVRRHCDDGAVRAKRWHQRLWMVSLITTFVTLIICIVGLWKPRLIPLNAAQWADVEAFILVWLVPCSAGILTLTGFAEISGDHARLWRALRRCAEELCTHAMLYRRRLPPYDGQYPDNEFIKTIEEIRSRADKAEGIAPSMRRFLPWLFSNLSPATWSARLLWMWQQLWPWYRIVWLPEHLDKNMPHTPDEENGTQADTEFAREEHAIYTGRLANQQRWHLLKARKYFKWFFCLQLMIIAVSLTAYVLVIFFQENGLGVVAVANLFVLGLFQALAFFDLYPQALRYLGVVSNLEAVRLRYHDLGLWPGASKEERLNRLAQEIEDVLRQEYEYSCPRLLVVAWMNSTGPRLELTPSSDVSNTNESTAADQTGGEDGQPLPSPP